MNYDRKLEIIRAGFMVIFVIGILSMGLVIPAKETKADVNKVSLKKVTQISQVYVKRKIVKLKWKEQPPAQEYQLRILNARNKLVKKAKAQENRKVIKGLKPNKIYKVRIRAKVNNKVGKYSRKFQIRTRLTNLRGIPFGFWGLNGYVSKNGLADVRRRFNQTVFQAASTNPDYTVKNLLPLVKKTEAKISLSLSGYHRNYTTDGDFDLTKWKAKIAAWKDSGVQSYINDGTLISHLLLDDIYNFEGHDPTAAELDEMARYSKEILPDLFTMVRQSAAYLPEPDDGQYYYLDAAINQYHAKFGDIDNYVTEQYAAAKRLNLDIVNGLNLCDGGDGSSGQPGWRRDGEFYAMGADEITAYGEALLSMPEVVMFLMWEYDSEEEWSDGTIGSDYFDQPDLQAAIYNIGKMAKQYSGS